MDYFLERSMKIRSLLLSLRLQPQKLQKKVSYVINIVNQI